MKKQTQLGMNPSTASARLVKDIVYSLIVKTERNNCHRCNKPMTRETFSIEHKVPWRHSADPVKLFFDLENISFSHLKCNTEEKRHKQPVCGKPYKYTLGCRCDLCVKANEEKNLRCRGRYNEAANLRDQATRKRRLSQEAQA